MILTVFLIIRNAVLYDYPFREVCRSVYSIADELLLLCDPGTDGTLGWCEQVAGEFPATRIIVEPWWQDGDISCLERAVNRCIEEVRTEYYFWLPADEALHEDDAPRVRKRCRRGGFDMANIQHLHFWDGFEQVLPDKQVITCPYAPLVGRRSLFPNMRCANPGADGIGTPGGVPDLLEAFWLKDVRLFHYGYVRDPRALIDKSAMMAAMAGQAPDPRLKVGDTGRIDWSTTFDETLLVPYAGTHPATMLEWIGAR